jgi:hypothetical protein
MAYTLRRVFWFVWRWRVERGQKQVRTGIAFSKAAARWEARSAIRSARACVRRI